MNLLILFCLFVALSPGLILTLPPLNTNEGIQRGISYQNDTSVDSCVAVGEWISNPYCDRAKSVIFSSQTSPRACLIHGIVLFIVLKLFFKVNYTIQIAVMFTALCPGLLLTLPMLSKNECATLGVAENDEFCDAVVEPNSACKQCTKLFFSKSTNIKAVIVHAILFIFICKVSKISS